MIIDKHKCIFIHINKTGGSSIETALNKNIKLDTDKRVLGSGNTRFVDKHTYALQYRKRNKETFDSYFKFAFVRNPWELEVSLFHWYKLALSYKHSFECLLNDRVKNNHMGFNRWIGDREHYHLMDFIGRFENLQEDFDIVCDKIGVTRKKLTHTNKTEYRHYTEYYDEKTKQIIAEKYAKDIEYFGYEFGE
jgi:hypothetical protein